MRRLLVIAALTALTACTKPCEELGNLICKCSPTGTSTDTCERQVSNVYDSADPSKDQDARCADYLDSCDAPNDVDFCEWLSSPDGKTACGLAY